MLNYSELLCRFFPKKTGLSIGDCGKALEVFSDLTFVLTAQWKGPAQAKLGYASSSPPF